MLCATFVVSYSHIQLYAYYFNTIQYPDMFHVSGMVARSGFNAKEVQGRLEAKMPRRGFFRVDGVDIPKRVPNV